VRQAAPPPSATSVTEEVVTAERRPNARRDAASKASAAARPDETEAVASGAPQGGLAAPSRVDEGAELRAAAADGRTADIRALLAKGAPVDAPDANGDTALMKAVRSDHAGAAALLRRRGADPDLRNRAGESARDLAAEKHDPALDRALAPDE
jgi:ankyrin repeat protein